MQRGKSLLATALVLLCSAGTSAQGTDDWQQAPGTLPPRGPVPVLVQLPPPKPQSKPKLYPRRAQPAHWEVDLGALGSIYTIQPGGQNGNRAEGYGAFVAYFKPITDDGAPRSLQPFLQRASWLSIGIAGGGLQTRVSGASRTLLAGYVGPYANLNAYLSPQFALTAGFSYQYSVRDDFGPADTTHTFSPTAGFGIRFEDWRFDASYRFQAAATNGSFEEPRWGTVDLKMFLVFSKQTTVRLSVELIDRGTIAGLGFGHYFSQDFGLFVGGFGGRGHLFPTDGIADRYGGSLGVAYWISPAYRLGPTYQLIFTKVHAGEGAPVAYDLDQIEHALLLEFAVRLR